MKKTIQFQTRVLLTFALIFAAASIPSASAQTHRPPPRPAVAPWIGERYANDADGDRIDDELHTRAEQAQAKLGESANVELIFKEPVTQRQIDTFTALGGEIT